MSLRHLAVAALLLLSLLVIVPGDALAQTGDLEAGPVHINMKAGDALSVVTDPDPDKAPESKPVQAQYGGGSNCVKVGPREWTDIGTWTSEGWPAVMNHSGDVAFNLWVINDESCDPGSADFRFTLRNSTEDIGTVTTSGTPQNIPTEITATLAGVDLNLAEEETLEIYLEYSGWNDIRVLYDNMSMDSGFGLQLNSLAVFDLRASNDQVSIEFYDAFDTTWRDNLEGGFVNAYIDNAQASANQTLGKEVRVGNQRTVENGSRTVTSTIIVIDIEAQDNNTLGIDLGYGLDYTLFFDNLTRSGGVAGGEDDDDNGLPGFELLLALPAVLFVAAWRRRRG